MARLATVSPLLRWPVLYRAFVAARQFTDASGLHWEVFEVRRHAERIDAAPAGQDSRWLTFISLTEKRRLAEYPEAWWSFDDAGLASLCGSAQQAPSTRARSATAATVAAPALVVHSSSTDHVTPRHAELVSESEVQRQARAARAAGTPAVQAMIALKRVLAAAGVEAPSPEFKRARRLFVDAFYFG